MFAVAVSPVVLQTRLSTPLVACRPLRRSRQQQQLCCVARYARVAGQSYGHTAAPHPPPKEGLSFNGKSTFAPIDSCDVELRFENQEKLYLYCHWTILQLASDLKLPEGFIARVTPTSRVVFTTETNGLTADMVDDFLRLAYSLTARQRTEKPEEIITWVRFYDQMSGAR